MNRFPDHDFKIDCGDDPRVRQWLHDNGCNWACIGEITDYMRDSKLLVVQGARVLCRDGMRDDFDNCKYPLINPFDYFQPEPTVAKRMAALIEEYNHCIPFWAKWVAVDEDGDVYAYADEPVIYGNEDYFQHTDNNGHTILFVTSDKLLLSNWRETLTELPTVKSELIVEDDAPKAGDVMIFVNDKSPLHNTVFKLLRPAPAIRFMLPDGHYHDGQAPGVWVIESLSGAISARTSDGSERATRYGCGEPSKMRKLTQGELEALQNPSKPADNRAEIAARDERELSPAELEWRLAQTDPRCFKPIPKTLTIPSICLADHGFQMMLGGEHGGQNYE